MANGNGFVQRAPLPPLNSPTITEADRARVYGVIGKELNNILNGATSYHSDSVKKSSRDLMSELEDFIGAVGSFKETVNDPTNIVGDAVRNLNRFKEAFEAATSNDIETMWNNPADERDQRIKLPDSFAPTTEDHNVIYVDPESDGQFSAPNPLSPNQWPKDMKASTGSSNDVAASAASPYIYPRLVSRVVSSALGSTNAWNTKQPPSGQQSERPLGVFSGKPMPRWTTPLPLGGLLDNSKASGNDDRNWFTSLGGITPENPNLPAPPEQIGGSRPVRFLGRRIVDPPQASAFDTGAPAVPLVPSDDPNFSGGLLGRLAAVLAGIDPENPEQAVSQPGGLLGRYLSGRR